MAFSTERARKSPTRWSGFSLLHVSGLTEMFLILDDRVIQGFEQRLAHL